MTKSKHGDEAADRTAADIEAMKLRQSKFRLKIDQIETDSVTVPHRLRALEQSRVDELAESMVAIGLQQPITVWYNHPEGAEEAVYLVAGAHRLAAAIKLGWYWIDAIYVQKMDDIDRALWEIDENLIRTELTPAEHADHLARRKELWKQQSSGPTCPTGGGAPGENIGFAADTAKATGHSKRSINRSLARGKAIERPVLGLIAGTDLDRGTYLDSLKGMTPDEQRAQVRSDLAEPKKPKGTYVNAQREQQFENLKRDWSMAPKGVRLRFLAWLNEHMPPVSDGRGGDSYGIRSMKREWTMASPELRRQFQAWVQNQETSSVPTNR